MQRAFLDINGVRTHVVTYGKWVEESFKASEPKDIILLIPGNPGVTGFYRMFMHTLHEKTGFPVWIVGHAGHEISKNNGVQPWAGNENLFGLKGQIEHKVDFIKKYVPEDCRLHLVGHSVGSYIIVKLLKEKAIKANVIDINLLFPTVEYIVDTPNGKFMTNFVEPALWLIYFLSWIFVILPSFLSKTLLYIYMKVMRIPMMHFRTLFYFVEPSILEKVFCMAFEEFEQIRERDDDVFKENMEKLHLLYGKQDGWTPARFYDQLKLDFPKIHAEVTLYDHTFVLKQSRQIGNTVASWILAK